MISNKIILFSGGTGGHVIPCVNFGNFLIKKGFNCTIVMDHRGKKYSSSFMGKTYVINSSHLSGNFLFKIKSIVKLFMGFFQSLNILLKHKPKIVISFGSYATLMPMFVILIIKFFTKIEIYIHEQNSVMGKVNYLFLPFVKGCFTNFELNQKSYTKYKKKLIHVGLPSINDKIPKINKKNSKLNKIVIFLYGGSQGSVTLINKFLLLLTKIQNKYLVKLHLFIQAPKNMHYQLIKVLKNYHLTFEIKTFFTNVDEILSISDIAFTRAGAGTISDLIKHTSPSIIMPLPKSNNNHQLHNAKFLSDKQGAILVYENNFNIDTSSKALEELINDKKIRTKMTKQLLKIRLLNANKLMLENII